MCLLAADGARVLADLVATAMRGQLRVMDVACDGFGSQGCPAVEIDEAFVSDRAVSRRRGDRIRWNLHGGARSRILALIAIRSWVHRALGRLRTARHVPRPSAYDESVVGIQVLARRTWSVSLSVGERDGIVLDVAHPRRLCCSCRDPEVLFERGIAAGNLPRVGGSGELREHAWDQTISRVITPVRATASRPRARLGQPAVAETRFGTDRRICGRLP
ncbi:hypothetical protein [Streptomyces sp. NPDC001450]